MHPAPSIILFTSAAGAGYGLLGLLAVLAPWGLIPNHRWLGLVAVGLALTLITVGLLASTLHLGHPERAWRAMSQWRSSWLSREGVLALLTFPPAVLFGVGWVVLEDTGGWVTLWALLAAIGAVATVYCTAMIYASLKPIQQWHHPVVPPVYLALALMTGALLLQFLLALFGAATSWAGGLALIAIVAALGLKAFYWNQVATMPSGSTPESATGLGEPGQVRPLDPPHTQTNYLLEEMGYRVGRQHAEKLRKLFYLLAAGAGIASLLALPLPGWPAVILTLLAAIGGVVATLIERWLFFAEATHTVTLYYGQRAA